MDAVLIVFTLAALHPDAMHGMLRRAWEVSLAPKRWLGVSSKAFAS